jgi:hypothetical protein
MLSVFTVLRMKAEVEAFRRVEEAAKHVRETVEEAA